MSMLEPVYHVPSPVHFEEVVTSTSSSSSPSPFATLLDHDTNRDGIEGVNYIHHLQKHHQQQQVQNCQQTHSEVCGTFCIKWINFEEHLQQSQKEREKHGCEDNVTFACQQNVDASTRRWVLLKAKRNEVMTTSLLLRNELQARPDDRPICLWDIDSKTMTQVLHYIKHGIVFGPIRDMNALIKANHILRIGAIWPNKYAYRLAALIGTSHNTNNKFRMSEHKPWVKVETEESPVDLYDEIQDGDLFCTDPMFLYEVPNSAMDSATATKLPTSSLPPRRKSVIVDASEVGLPPKYQTKWFSPERLPTTAKECAITPETIPKPQRGWDVTSGPNIISPRAPDRVEPVSTCATVQPTETRNIYANIFTSPDYIAQTQHQQSPSKNFYSEVLSALDRKSSLQKSNKEPLQNSTPPAPHNSPVDDNLPCSYEVITPPPQTTTCAPVPAGVKMVSIYSTNIPALSANKSRMLASTSESSGEKILTSAQKSVEPEVSKLQMLLTTNLTQSSATLPEANQHPAIIPLPPFNQIKSSTSRMIPESQQFNKNPKPVLSSLIQNPSPTATATATFTGEQATPISGSQTRLAVTQSSQQVLPLATPVLPQTLKPITPPPLPLLPPPPPYTTQDIIPPSAQSPQTTTAAPMPRKKYIMALACTQQTAQKNTNSNLCAQEIHTNLPTAVALPKRAPTNPSSIQSSIIPPSFIQRSMPTRPAFPQGQFPFTRPQQGASPFIQKHKTSFSDVPNQIMGPPPPKRPPKVSSTITSAEFHYNAKQALQNLPQDSSANLSHHLISRSTPQQSFSQQAGVVTMDSLRKSQNIQRIHYYPNALAKIKQQIAANQYQQRLQSQGDLNSQHCKTSQFQHQQRQQLQQQMQHQQWQPASSSAQRSVLHTRVHPYHQQRTFTASSVYGYRSTSIPPFFCKWCRNEKTFNTKLQLRFHFLFEHKSVESLRNPPTPTDSLKAGNRVTDNCTYKYKCLNQYMMTLE